jgi:hypothetical protein
LFGLTASAAGWIARREPDGTVSVVDYKSGRA